MHALYWHCHCTPEFATKAFDGGSSDAADAADFAITCSTVAADAILHQQKGITVNHV